MTIAILLASIANFIPGALAGHYASKGLEVYGKSEADLKDELQQVIEDTIQEYAERFPQESGRDLPFYHSVKIVDELLKFRVMKPEEYNPQNLMSVIQQERYVMAPTVQNLEDFYDLFIEKVNASQDLKKLEIQQDFQQEIFSISRNIESLKDHINNLAQSYSGDLENQWKDRLDSYVKTLQKFKPATALMLLESLEQSFNTSTKRPGNNFLAFLDHQKGLCLSFLGRSKEGYTAHIRAWNLDRNNILFTQSAAISYYRLEEYEQAKQICKELVTIDPFNAVGWAIPMLCESSGDFEQNLAEVPTLVKNDIAFKRVLYNQANSHRRIFADKIHASGLLPSCLEYHDQEVTIDTYNDAVFWFNVCSTEIFAFFFLDFKNVNKSQQEKIQILNTVLKRFLDKMRDSELPDNFSTLEFYYQYTNFSLFEEEQFALEMERHYYKMGGTDNIRMLHCANALQLTGHPDRAIKLLEAESTLTTEAILLLLYCYLSIEEIDQYVANAKRYFRSITLFEDYMLLMFLNLLVELKLHGQISSFSVEDVLSDREYKTEMARNLVTALTNLVFESYEDDDIAVLDRFIEGSEDYRLVDVVGSAFFCSGLFEQALSTLAKNLDGKAAGRELYQYIHALKESGKAYHELLAKLKYWRQNYDFIAGFLLMEVDMRRELMDWEEVVDIAEYYLNEIPEQEGMVAVHILALNKINSPESIAKIIGKSAEIRDFNYRFMPHVKQLSFVLFSRGLVMDAFELLYRYAINPEEVDLRGAYFTMVLRLPEVGDGPTPLEEFTEATGGHFVKFEHDGEVNYAKLDKKAAGHRLHSQLFGKKNGETFKVKRNYVNNEDTFVITRIMNKYLFLHDQIMHQAEKDPHAGLPFISLKIDPENPGGFFDMMKNMFGKNHELVERTKDANFRDFYNYDLSFSEIIMREYKNDFLNGYYNLIEYHQGMPITQRLLYPLNSFSEDLQYVIDFSALLLFYQISFVHGTFFPEKFLISKYLVEALRAELQGMQFSLDRNLSAPFQFGVKVTPEYLFAFRLDHKQHLQGMLTWIEENCESVLSENTIEYINKANLKIGEELIIDVAFSTTFLMQDQPKRILITDDTFYLKYRLLPISSLRSTELYTKHIFSIGRCKSGRICQKPLYRLFPNYKTAQ